MTLDTPVSKVFMVGPSYARKLARLKIKTVRDLVYHFPFRYLDYSIISPIAKIQAGETVSVCGKVIDCHSQYIRGGKTIQKALIADKTGQLAATWFNQPFLKTTLKVGSQIFLAGKVEFFGAKKMMTSPDYEILDKTKSLVHTGRLVPVYHETAGISSKWLRSRLTKLLPNLKIEDFLPSTITQKHDLMDLKQAIEQIHFPKSHRQSEKARERLAFDEMFMLQLAAWWRKKAWQQKKLAYQFSINQPKLADFIKSMPFSLTAAQKRAIKEICQDLGKNQPMNRLLTGDVGSGKTVVASAAIFIAYLNKTQAALMAPTEVLANQHFLTLNRLLSPLGLKIKLLTSASKEKKVCDFDLLVGTHALIHQRACFDRLGLVVIDEQHRFGVIQRAKLIQQNKATPHLLTMTATPIPRTIALTAYGDLDLSVLDEMPPGRQKIKTWLVPEQKRQAAYTWLRRQIQTNHSQAFIVCPFIEPSETLQAVKAVQTEFKKLKKLFPQFKLGLLHGRLSSSQKESVLKKFQDQKIDILVATPVVEVGIDIPNATIMIIEGAQRFGLAQLHQLRGRVGRGQKQSYCLLFGKTSKRLMALKQISSGRQLAEIDLKMRGPGQIYGTHQHGFFQMQLASFSDWPLIKKSRQAVRLISREIKRYPALQAKLKEYKINLIEPN